MTFSAQRSPVQPVSGNSHVEPPDDAGPDVIEEHIRQTRHELGETVEALAAKFDVKAQAQHTAEVARHRADEFVGQAKDTARQPATLAIAGGIVAAAAGVIGFLVWRRQR